MLTLDNPGAKTFPELDRLTKKYLDRRLQGAGYQRRTSRRDHRVGYLFRTPQKWIAGLEFYAHNTLENTIVAKVWPLNRHLRRAFTLAGTTPLKGSREPAFQFGDPAELEPWMEAVAAQLTEPLLRQMAEVVPIDFPVRAEMLALHAATYAGLGFEVARADEALGTGSHPFSLTSLEPLWTFEFARPGHPTHVQTLVSPVGLTLSTYRIRPRGRSFDYDTLHGLESNYGHLPPELRPLLNGPFKDQETFRDLGRRQAEWMMTFLD